MKERNTSSIQDEASGFEKVGMSILDFKMRESALGAS